MKLYVYAPAQAVIERPDLLARLLARYDLCGVILRSAEREAFDIVRRHDLDAFWLAPGLWGHIEFEERKQAAFGVVPGWNLAQYPAYESQFPMHCPNTPDLAEENGFRYAETAKKLEATGVFGTHVRYHHPADIEHLWGCMCDRCRASAPLDLDVMAQFLSVLKQALETLPVEQWRSVHCPSEGHPLVAWWAAVTQMDFPLRWFEWKNRSIGDYLVRLRNAFENELPGQFFATNCFEPFLGPLVGNSPDTQRSSNWYAPLMGYWTHHVYDSLRNIAAWQCKLAGHAKPSDAFQAIARLVGGAQPLEDAAAAIEVQLRMGAENAAHSGRDYYPILNGTIANQYGGTANQFALSRGIELAGELGASGIIAQGISQLLDDSTLDFWY